LIRKVALDVVERGYLTSANVQLQAVNKFKVEIFSHL